MHPATMQALAAQRGNDLRVDAAGARQTRRARLSQLAERHGQFSASEPAGAALSTPFCQTLAVVSNSDAANKKTSDRSPHQGPRRWTVSGLSGFHRVAGSPIEP